MKRLAEIRLLSELLREERQAFCFPNSLLFLAEALPFTYVLAGVLWRDVL